jgi:hypothetical protein
MRYAVAVDATTSSRLSTFGGAVGRGTRYPYPCGSGPDLSHDAIDADAREL